MIVSTSFGLFCKSICEHFMSLFVNIETSDVKVFILGSARISQNIFQCISHYKWDLEIVFTLACVHISGGVQKDRYSLQSKDIFCEFLL